MQGAIFFVQIRIGVLLSRKCSIWCRKLLFFFNSTCAHRLLASRRRWHGGSEPAQLWRAAFCGTPAWTGSAVTTPVTPSVESWLHLELRLSLACGWQDGTAAGFGPGEGMAWQAGGLWWSSVSQWCPAMGRTGHQRRRALEMLQVHRKSPYHHHTGRLRVLFTGEWRQEGIWRPRLLTEAALQAEGRCQQLRQCRVPHLGTASFFFSSCVCTSLCAGLLWETPALWPQDPHAVM